MTFDKTVYTDIEGKGRVRFSLVGGDTEQFVEASGLGVQVKDVLVTDRDELQAFAKIVADAWVEHKRLKPRIVSTLAGH